jgi:hypothetical protein
LILACSFISWNTADIFAFWWYPSLPRLGICTQGHWRNQWIMGEIGEEEDSCWRALTSLRPRSMSSQHIHSFSMLFLCDICIASFIWENSLRTWCL